MKRQKINYLPDYYYSKVVDIVDHESTKHSHESLEIYYMKEGVCNYIIGNSSYRIGPGDIVIIPANQPHRTNYGGIAHTRLLVNCSYDYIPESVKQQLESIGSIYRNVRVVQQLDEIFAKIEQEYKSADSLSADVLRCYTSELFFLLLRNENEREEKKSDCRQIDEVIKYIQNNYMNELRLSAAAEHFLISREHLSRMFKKETGFGFKEYITLLRLQKAEEMLKNEPGRAVCEIAYACGFNDGNYFSYKFKQAYGLSPTQVRGGCAKKQKKKE